MVDRQNIFNRDFYPTPDGVIEQMLKLTDVRGKIILEPSAGSGNIVNFCKKRGAREVIACEINDKLRAIVAGKCRVIASDFLEVTADMVSHVDLIVMNPPFSTEEKHILHAYEIAPEGCEVISLCNNSMLSYSHTENSRKVNELINLYGSSEYLGNVFTSAERTTDVSVSVLRLYKPKTGEHEFDDFFDLTDEEETTMNGEGGIVKYNYIQDLVSRYRDALDCFDNVMTANKQINEICSGLGRQTIKFGAHRYNSYNHSLEHTNISRDEFRKQLQKDAWKGIFEKLDMRKYVTRQVQEDLNRAIEIVENMPFTVRNIYQFIKSIVATHGDRMQRTLVEAFDYICSLSAENSTAGEKWKTNSDYMINRRFIIPHIVDYDSRYPSFYPFVRASLYGSRIDDVIKALCYITGRDYNDTSSLSSFFYDNRVPYGDWREWTYKVYDKENKSIVLREWSLFRVRGYKKGTMHFEFVDEDVWYKFNQAVASVKGWQLPKQHEKKTRK